MLIDKNFSKYMVLAEDNLSLALDKITLNKSGMVLILSNDGAIQGVMTDGDIRRWLLETENSDLNQPAIVAANKNFLSASYTSSPELIQSLFNERIKYIPLVDPQNRLMAIAFDSILTIHIGEFSFEKSSPCFIIAEIGNNHNGSIEMAFQLVDEAIKAGADCAKFQMRNMGSVYGSIKENEDSEDLGAQYTLDLLSRFQLSNSELFTVFDYCTTKGILPLCTPWDIDSLIALENYGMVAYKMASADLSNTPLLIAMCKTHKPLICSTGMSFEAEIKDAVDILTRHGSQFILLHCNSTYPAPYKDINLNYLDHLKILASGFPVGYSGHERGISVPIAAVAKGAKVIEKHFTLDRNMEGNDHRVSLLPEEFKLMVDSIREVELSLGTSELRKITQGEMMNREVLGKSLVATRDIVLGQIISDSDVEIRGPGKGLSPNRKTQLVGIAIQRNLLAGDFFFQSDIEENRITARPYIFQRPFGIPVRYHDVNSLIDKSNFDLLEFHFSYKDLDIEPLKYLSESGYDLDFVVHSPELFVGDHILDLCSEDSKHRLRSIDELQRVIDVTRNLKKYFRKSKKPLIVVNAGGFTLDEFMDKSLRAEKYKLIASAFNALDTDGVEIIPQTMPPFPWHFGGQRFHNLFMDASDIVEFCSTYNYRICLDVSHSKLACNFTHYSFSEFLDNVAPYAAHLHLVDAYGVDGEGVQIGDGEIDFSLLSNKIYEHCPNASFIPEIWQGHKNGGEGFWSALNILEKYFSQTFNKR